VVLGPGVTSTVPSGWLFSYRPTPGTLFYLGWLDAGRLEQFRFNAEPASDGFFGK
jgi:hypothetical protein